MLWKTNKYYGTKTMKVNSYSAAFQISSEFLLFNTKEEILKKSETCNY